ncbi:MAG: DsrE/DsrF/DrsH-like family protein [Chloroflexota bacterium]
MDRSVLSLVLFSGTDDKLNAAAVAPRGRRRLGRPVHVFLQYWALEAFRKDGIEADHGLAHQPASGRAKVDALRTAGEAWHHETLRQARSWARSRSRQLLSMDLLQLEESDLDPLVDGVEGVTAFYGHRRRPDRLHLAPHLACGGTSHGQPAVVAVDARNLSCPMPIVKTAQQMKTVTSGQLVEVLATDPGSLKDYRTRPARPATRSSSRPRKATSSTSSSAAPDRPRPAHPEGRSRHDRAHALNTPRRPSCRRRRSPMSSPPPRPPSPRSSWSSTGAQYDRIVPTLIAVATTAAASGTGTSVFITFWGLLPFVKDQKRITGENWMQKMLSAMQRPGIHHLKMSKMNFMGMGPWMIGQLSEKYNVSSPAELLEGGPDAGRRVLPCQMTMDMFGP